MNRAVSEWCRDANLPLSNAEKDGLSKQLSRSYTLYGSLLLLPATLLDSISWAIIESRGEDARQSLLQHIAKHLKITHVAVTKPIPPRNKDEQETENVIRAPSNFTPLHGDFGPAKCNDPPAREDFEAAYWVTAKQNGISQTWAPRWTMFSRGNISEKARILALPSVTGAVEEGQSTGSSCTAVDLYAGIGYFVFSYLKAGVEKVLCWDLNPWSIEGLRRGAAANKWKAATHDAQTELIGLAQSDARLLVFNESNEHAALRVTAMKRYLPPIRHVNCGLLPTSRGSWDTALAVLDTKLGGWVHIHENFDQREIEQKGEEVRAEFQRMLDLTTRPTDGRVVLEHINRVKTYAPGVYHVVLDIYIPPRLAPSAQQQPN